MENNTNFNWKQKKSGLKEVLDKEVSIRNSNQVIQAVDFYEQSNYFIDTLKDEFCRPVGDDWMEFKEPVNMADIEDLPSVKSKQSPSKNLPSAT
mmetsp:Transcript_5289/g.8182  ORF Transcript_5289/g.8182 Transcript_5289/m.8182 type:complete len:94 (+) Transcript_5289:129-410(+)